MNVDEPFEGVKFVDSTVASDTFNVVSCHNLNNKIPESIAREIVDFYLHKNYPFAWWVGPNSQSFQVDLLLEKIGLT